jgi:hypothetical protein
LRQAHQRGARLMRSDDVPRASADATGRLIEICQARGAEVYVTGPTARAYVEAARFAAAGIELCFANYSGYPRYDQGIEPFDNHTSLLDTLFNCGPGTRTHLKSLRDRSAFLDPV